MMKIVLKAAPSPFRDERDGKKAFSGTFVENGDEKQTPVGGHCPMR
jgi:hypothetical protein